MKNFYKPEIEDKFINKPIQNGIMDKITIIHDKKDCISCGACAAISPDFWIMDEEGLAHLKGSEQMNSHWEKDISTEVERAAHQEAADVCPVNIIHLKKKENQP